MSHILNFLLHLCLVCSGNPLHSTALEDEGRPESDRRHKATAGKRSGERREIEDQGVRQPPKRPAHAAKNPKAQHESNVQAQEKQSSKSRRIQKPPRQTDQTPKSQYLKFSLYFIFLTCLSPA